ncbi:uncharacterized protein BDR25DRAFT_355112 [Lindgomyces ingoldianus]|uniref:Uncharacterized protein n=1 Tax=Lindgomyces ingoldianus TaxID=673940 RepID=A0ACB6QUQ1_9PLEO|nr:uncharacterized protein BDR25DRAFT_355112 [Lindgomyces ingoldianus]KAF2470625.1 hypothetical protein BDR25DRAFT_355112 [Lindgomyces ingoldianus]
MANGMCAAMGEMVAEVNMGLLAAWHVAYIHRTTTLLRGIGAICLRSSLNDSFIYIRTTAIFLVLSALYAYWDAKHSFPVFKEALYVFQITATMVSTQPLSYAIPAILKPQRANGNCTRYPVLISALPAVKWRSSAVGHCRALRSSAAVMLSVTLMQTREWQRGIVGEEALDSLSGSWQKISASCGLPVASSPLQRPHAIPYILSSSPPSQKYFSLQSISSIIPTMDTFCNPLTYHAESGDGGAEMGDAAPVATAAASPPAQAPIPPLPAFVATLTPVSANPAAPIHQFTGILTPFQMHARIVHNRHLGRYYSLTILPEPYTTWSPLPSHREMETRPCFTPASRIHQLECGHFVAVPRDAERCAANCKGMLSQLPSGEKHRIRSIFNLCVAVSDSIPGLKHTYPGMPHMTNLVDEASGDFTCATCHLVGQRQTSPAHIFLPMHCIIVVREQQDAALVTELERGVLPISQRLQNRAQTQNPRAGHSNSCGCRGGHRSGRSRCIGGGRGGRGAGVTRRRVEKARREEKKEVTGKILEDNLLEEWQKMEERCKMPGDARKWSRVTQVRRRILTDVRGKDIAEEWAFKQGV